MEIWQYVIPCVAAFLTAILTFFSGFGLGTILTPVLLLFFPVDLAIALTGVVHFFNNLFKLGLVGLKADRSVLIKFGVPAILAALLGSWLLLSLTNLPTLFSYTLGDTVREVSPLNFIIAILLIFFGLMDLLPALKKLEFGKKWLPVGGVLSGFFGGLSGHQGALRSAFLIRAGLSKEAFIGTAVVISALVDFTRLGVYATRFADSGIVEQLPLVIAATICAVAGAFIGNKLLKKVTLDFIQNLVAVMLILIAIALGSGLI